MTKWSKESSEKFPKQWTRSNTKILDCFYDVRSSDKIVCYDEQYLTVIDKTEPMPGPNEKVLTTQQSNKNGAIVSIDEQQNETVQRHAIHVTNKYRV